MHLYDRSYVKMSQRSSNLLEHEISSVVRGHHIYKTVCNPLVGEMLPLSKEHCNAHDKHAVSVMKGDRVVGHFPKELSRAVWHFLSHGGSAHCKVTGHRKKGKGLEVPCKYIFYGRLALISRLKKIISPSSQTTASQGCDSS